MNPMAIIGVISSVVGLAQTAAAFGHDVKPFVEILWNEVFARGEPQTEAEAEAIAETVRSRLEELRQRLHLPLAPAQADDV